MVKFITMLLLMLSSVSYGALTNSTKIQDKLNKTTLVVFNKQNMGRGTGFRLKYKKAYYILTNFHVCLHDETVLIKSLNNVPLVSEVLHVDVVNDICIIKDLQGPALTLAKKVDVNELLYTVGHPGNRYFVFQKNIKIYKPSFGESVVLSMVNFPFTMFSREDCYLYGVAVGDKCKIYQANHMYIDTKVIPGQSGSALVNSRAQVVAIIHSYSVLEDRLTGKRVHLGGAVPLRYILDNLKKVYDNDYRK